MWPESVRRKKPALTAIEEILIFVVMNQVLKKLNYRWEERTCNGGKERPSVLRDRIPGPCPCMSRPEKERHVGEANMGKLNKDYLRQT